MPFIPYHFGPSKFFELGGRRWLLVVALLAVLVTVCSGRFADVNHLHPGDLWGLTAYSENGRFTALLTWPADFNECVLQVYDVNGPEKTLLWKANAPWKDLPGNIFLSNDGKYVVTLDDPQQTSGDDLEFYVREQGKIKGYSREQLLGFCEALTGKGQYNHFPTFYIFHTFQGLTYFCGCIFGKAGLHWVCWSAADGQHLNLDQAVVHRVTDDARRHFRKELGLEAESRNKILACLFLSHFKRPEDRPHVEKLLADRDFVTNPMWVEKSSFLQTLLQQINIETQTRYELDYFCASSGLRRMADKHLVEWDGKAVQTKWPFGEYPYFYLGRVSLKVALKKTPKKVGGLWVYLIPATVTAAEWEMKRPVHYLMADFDGLGSEYEIGRTVACIFGSVTPGKYWIKAVWDKEKPFEPFNRRSDDFCKPEKGDYESVDSPVIEVKAGQTVDVGVIECKHNVTGN